MMLFSIHHLVVAPRYINFCWQIGDFRFVIFMSKQKHKKMDPDAALALIVKNNKNYVKTHDPAYFLEYETEQKPNVIYLGCMDSRVHLIAFVENPNNKIMVVRNMGNQLKTAEGSVDYAIHGQNTPLLLIVGHPYCGAVENIFYDYMNNSDFTKAMKKELKRPSDNY